MWKFFKDRLVLWLVMAVLLALVLTAIFVTYSVSPDNFPEKKIITIKNGTSISQTATLLEKNNIIKSPFLFKVLTVGLSGQKKIQSGDYLFDKPQTVILVAYRISHGLQGLPKTKVRILEGSTVTEIGSTLKKAIPSFDLQKFLALAKPYEGYLYPDTYYFYETASPETVIDTLRQNFENEIKTTLLSIQAFGKPMSDVITMASIVEKEAFNREDRKKIAGILWRRLEMNMPLQVDPPFLYVLGKGSLQLTTKDLAMDSPYNLYKHTGLTPTPIGNPSLEAIYDTVNPTKSDYLFFLSDKKGTMHYAVTHEDHVANKVKYLQ